MAILNAQQAVNTRDLPELTSIKNDDFNQTTQQGQSGNEVVNSFVANATYYRFSPYEIELRSNVDGHPGDLDYFQLHTYGGTFRKIVVQTVDGMTKSDAYTITGFELELDTDLWADAQDGKLDTVPAEIFKGDDTLNGSAFADVLFAFDGEDNVQGGAGDDEIDGGADDDQLTGGLGADTQSGGLGADAFIFLALGDSTKKASGRDSILDFDRAEADTIDLTAIDARKGSGNQDFKFIGKQDFHDKKGELRYVVKNGDAIVQGDTNGDGKVDFSIHVDGVSKLKALDFDL